MSLALASLQYSPKREAAEKHQSQRRGLWHGGDVRRYLYVETAKPPKIRDSYRVHGERDAILGDGEFHRHR
jgi:hypothetical protein